MISGDWRRPLVHRAGDPPDVPAIPVRNYVMLPAALEQERLFVAERLLSEIERRHGLPHPANREIHPVIIERFLITYLPETRDGEPAPSALEFAFAPSLTEGLNLLRGIVSETDSGFGAALYIYDLDTGTGGVGSLSDSAAPSSESQRSTIQ